MAHHSHEINVNWKERFVFPKDWQNWLKILVGVGLLLVLVGFFTVGGGEAHSEVAGEAHHHVAPWLKRLSANLLISSMYVLGISILSVFFLAVGYAANAGWYVMLQRIPQTMSKFLPIGIIGMVAVTVGLSSVLYEWTHSDVVAKDEILQHKSGYLNLPFFIARLVIILGGWFLFWRGFRRAWEALDQTGDIRHFHTLRRLAGGFIVFFALSWSVASWDWLMSTSPHWFSTMFAVYNFANLWITTICFITFSAALLKLRGFLSGVTESHMHDLGKFVFAFSIFWTYIFYGQFMLIWYANIPEETFWFYERVRAHVNPQYVPIFFVTLVLNFLFPLLGLMSASIKRSLGWLAVVTAVLMFTHWLDSFMVVMPSVAGKAGGLGPMEIGFYLVTWAGYLWWLGRSLEKAPYLMPQRHPYLEESMQHSYETM